MITQRQRQAVIKTAIKLSDEKVVRIETSNQVRAIVSGVFDMVRNPKKRPFVTILFVNKEEPNRRMEWFIENQDGKITMTLNGNKARSLFDVASKVVERIGVQ